MLNLKTCVYINVCQSIRKCSILAEFRMEVLPLAIETGRCKKINVNGRYYQFCTNNKLEDEEYMLCQCSLCFKAIVVSVRK